MSEPTKIYWAGNEKRAVSEKFDFGHFEIEKKELLWMVSFVASPTAKIKIGWANNLDAAKEKALLSYESINLAFKMGAESVERRNREPKYH